MAALVTLLVVVLGFTVYCVVDLARAEEFRSLDRETWALIAWYRCRWAASSTLRSAGNGRFATLAPARGG